MDRMVRYRVKPDRAAENEALVREVYTALERERPAGLRYSTFKAADGVTFVHVAHIETADGANPLAALDAFQRFVSAIRERCEEPPVTVELTPVGAYEPPKG